MKPTRLPIFLCQAVLWVAALAVPGGPALAQANIAPLLDYPDFREATPAARPSPVDPHIRYVTYDPDRVVRVTGYTGYQIIVEFAPDERIETVGIGDSSTWQVTPNGAATIMFLKPVAAGRPTNLAIVTNLRRYNLELSARLGTQARTADIIYALRFRYPQAEKAKAEAAAPTPLTSVPSDQWNRAYSFDGAKGNVPEEMFDDGKATYLRFSPDRPTPAIFAVTDKTGEAIVNSSQRGAYIVVDQLAPLFVLRQGPDVTRIYNDKYAAPALGDTAPQERSSHKKSPGTRRHGLFGGGKAE